jgi:hypothetical protein
LAAIGTRAERDAAILAGVAKIGDGGGDAAGRSALERIDHDQQLHQVLVGRRAGRLQDEHVHAAHMLLDFDADFAVGETADVGTTKRDVETLDDVGSQFRIGVAGKYHQAVVGHVRFPVAPEVRRRHKAIRAGSLQQTDLPALTELEWLGKKDSNLRMPESKSGALTNLATPQLSGTNLPLQGPEQAPLTRSGVPAGMASPTAAADTAGAAAAAGRCAACRSSHWAALSDYTVD